MVRHGWYIYQQINDAGWGHGSIWSVTIWRMGCVMVGHFTWVRHYASPCYKRVCTVCAIYSRHGDRTGLLNMQTPWIKILTWNLGAGILSQRAPKIESDDMKWNGNPKIIIIYNLCQILSQAVFCLGSQKREEIRYFSSLCKPRSFQHCTALFSSCMRMPRWSRSVALVLGWIETWIFM